MDVFFVFCFTAVGSRNAAFVNTPFLFCRKYWLAEDRVLIMFFWTKQRYRKCRGIARRRLL